MKKTNVLLSMVLTICLICSLTLISTAASESWDVQYNGKKIVDNYTGAINEELTKMQPGDDATFKVELTNKAGKSSEWYMKNSVIQTLEESNVAANNQGGLYAYKLEFVSPTGEVETIIDSETVGGEGSKAKGVEGLREGPKGLEDWFYLGTLEGGEDGTVLLSVSLDKETQGNAYQETLGKLSLRFAVAEDGETTIVKTGDSNSLVLWCAIFGLSAVLIAVMIMLVLKRRKEAE